MTIRRAQRVKDHRGQRMVADPDCADDFLTVRCDGATIIAQRQDREPIVIEPRWNRETLTCDLHVGKQPRPLWHVSQEILEPFLFDFES